MDSLCLHQKHLRTVTLWAYTSIGGTWEEAGRRSGSIRPAPTGQSTSGWCTGSCCCCGSTGSMTPAPRHWTAWSPRRPWCSPLRAGQSRRCRTSRTRWRSPGRGCCRSAGFPWSPLLKRCPLWQWWLEQRDESTKTIQWGTCSLLDVVRSKATYRWNMVCVRYDSFPLLLSLSSVWPTIDRTNGKYS